ncbi:type II toxin-antitoxin system HipA family toxin [Solwaraspora sp. WMMA2056]|uniref:type II toxin-antitoxin system HipA family toxin n=1 Tax=Solwaraspora sp. WMMA2056 TaxID=3015161 RepID=UPI00259BA285|nr:type II toxin-antitoxin system HipA family toxin [Solwaraspora sp. WMMA2056]WJK43342.1 type II toxin-antitoxin system HipA family toxin [Solwaraspora sp. WMMA2056]
MAVAEQTETSAATTLTAIMAGSVVGVITQQRDGRFMFSYENDWQARQDATPISLSMPLAHRTHDDPAVRTMMWGLLPDNERVLERWARDYQVSAGNPFALLRHVGEDCAGAAQLVTQERVQAAVDGAGGVHWLTVDDLELRLRTLRNDPTSWHINNSGQFSLAGAQAKTALYLDEASQRWGEPWGAVPTTHILKPAVTGLDEHDLNEHLCLAAAGLAGLPTARSNIVSFHGERAIAVERYDRRHSRGALHRIHQEDTCQALAIAPMRKYQNEGGPSPEQIIELLRREVRPAGVAAEHISRFVDALAFNWIIAGTDAHAKNYSLLLAGSQVRLAPLYDVASALPYDDMYLPKLRMAMRIGGEYRVDAVRGRHWRRFAEQNGLDAQEILTQVDALAARTPDCFAAAADDDAVRSLGSTLPVRLVQRVTSRAARCRQVLTEV